MAAPLPHHVVVAGPYEYLAITGWKIRGTKFAKKAVILPGQLYSRYLVSPENYTLEVQAMTTNKLPFLFPAVLSVGPNVNDEDSLVRYTNLVNSYRVNMFLQGIIRHEIREVAASMTTDEIFNNETRDFKNKVFDKVELALNKFGLIIYHANFKQLVRVSGHDYFSTQNAAKIDSETANIERVSDMSMMMESMLDFLD